MNHRRPECASLDDVRTNIDRIDAEIVRLIAERGTYVGEAARHKTKRDQIVDGARIESVITRMRQRADALGLDADIAEHVFRTMIDRFIAYEYEAFDRIHGAP